MTNIQHESNVLALTSYTKEELVWMCRRESSLSGQEKAWYDVLATGIAGTLYGYDYQAYAHRYTKGTRCEAPFVDADKLKFGLLAGLEEYDSKARGYEFTDTDIAELMLRYNMIALKDRSQFVMDRAVAIVTRDGDDDEVGLETVRKVALLADYLKTADDTTFAEQAVAYVKETIEADTTPLPQHQVAPPKHVELSKAVGDMAFDVYFAKYLARDLCDSLQPNYWA